MFALCATFFSFWNSSKQSEMASKIKIELMKNRSVILSFNKLLSSFGIWNFGQGNGKVKEVLFDSYHSQIYSLQPKLSISIDRLKELLPKWKLTSVNENKLLMMLEYKCRNKKFIEDFMLGDTLLHTDFTELSVAICHSSLDSFISKGMEFMNDMSSFPCEFLRICNIEVLPVCDIKFDQDPSVESPSRNLPLDFKELISPIAIQPTVAPTSFKDLNGSYSLKYENGKPLSYSSEQNGLTRGTPVVAFNRDEHFLPQLDVIAEVTPSSSSVELDEKSDESKSISTEIEESVLSNQNQSSDKNNFSIELVDSQLQIEKEEAGAGSLHNMIETMHLENEEIKENTYHIDVEKGSSNGSVKFPDIINGSDECIKVQSQVSKISHAAGESENCRSVAIGLGRKISPLVSYSSSESEENHDFIGVQGNGNITSHNQLWSQEVDSLNENKETAQRSRSIDCVDVSSSQQVNGILNADNNVDDVEGQKVTAVSSKRSLGLWSPEKISRNVDVISDNEKLMKSSIDVDQSLDNDVITNNLTHKEPAVKQGHNWAVKFQDESDTTVLPPVNDLQLIDTNIVGLFKDLVLPISCRPPKQSDSLDSDPWGTPSSSLTRQNSSCSSSRECLSYDSKKYVETCNCQKLSQASSLTSLRSLEECPSSSTITPFTKKKTRHLPARSKTLFNLTLKNIDNKSNSKPPNILIYTNDDTRRYEAVKNALLCCINSERYTLYPLKQEQVLTTPWLDNTTLLVVVGSATSSTSLCFVRYLLAGGKLFSICSNIVEHLLKNIKTTEFQEEALVTFSYKNLSKVELLHNFKRYQIKPISQGFSPDESYSNSRISVEYVDKEKLYNIQLETLASDPTWQSPIFLKGSVTESKGCILVSQVHLEVEPQDYQHKSYLFKTLQNNNAARLMLLQSLLTDYFNLDCRSVEVPTCTTGYLCGTHQNKMNFISNLKPHLSQNVLKRGSQSLKFIFPGDATTNVTQSELPVLVSSCPVNFSTVEYFENLMTKSLGRIVIYADVLSSTSDILEGSPLGHGVTIITRRQTKGRGRGGNTWLSPLGCCMFSLQVTIPLESLLGKSVSILQHLTSLAIVIGIKRIPGYENLDLKLKWPNDLYYGTKFKIGGIIVNTSVFGRELVCNIGCGINLNNSQPTSCINDIIKFYNQEHSTSLKQLTYEKLISKILNSLEELCSTINTEGVDAVLPLYYEHWLHSNVQVTVHCQESYRSATIVGVDTFGYLLVKLDTGKTMSVHPDGNSFDMLHGLIVPKYSM